MKKDLAILLCVIKHMSVIYKPSPEVKSLRKLIKRVEPCKTRGSFSDFSGWEKPLKVAISKG